ncbi:MAG: hypothetical protein RIR00_827 [Pseudomonadota bacterium]|jgi:cardiolipin synthase
MKPEYYPGNRLQLLDSGQDYFPRLLADLAAAASEIHLETYIFADDAIGHAVAGALAAAARRGVRVRILVDGFGARNFAADFRPQLLEAGVQCLIYRPEISPWPPRRHRLRRLHRKTVLIDNRVGYIGGINIIADENGPPELIPRRDYAVRIEGPLLQAMRVALLRVWEGVAWASFRRRYRLRAPLPPAPLPAGEQKAALLRRDCFRNRNDIFAAYLDALRHAESDILIANAYFLPGYRFRHALGDARRRGVRVRILLQGKSDHALLHYATRALYGALLAEGIEVYEYERSFLHAKVAVIDEDWATVGSANIDPFSLLLAKEGNLLARDRAFAGQLRASLENLIENGSVRMHPDAIKRMPWHSRILRWCSYGLVRLLVDVAGYGSRHWQGGEGD